MTVYILIEGGILYTSLLAVFDDLEIAKKECEKYDAIRRPNRNPMQWDGLNYRDRLGGGYFITPLEMNTMQEKPGIKYRENDRGMPKVVWPESNK